VTRLYERSDEWLRSLPSHSYAAVLGVSVGVGVLATGLLIGGELPLVEAVTMALVMFALEYTFGRFQASEE